MSAGCHGARNLQRARGCAAATNALGLYDSRAVGGLIGSVAVVNFDVYGFASRKARDVPVKRAALFYCSRAHACRRTRRIRGCSSRWQCRRGKSRGDYCPGQHRDETNSAYCLQELLPTHDHLFFTSGLVTLVLTDFAVIPRQFSVSFGPRAPLRPPRLPKSAGQPQSSPSPLRSWRKH